MRIFADLIHMMVVGAPTVGVASPKQTRAPRAVRATTRSQVSWSGSSKASKGSKGTKASWSGSGDGYKNGDGYEHDDGYESYVDHASGSKSEKDEKPHEIKVNKVFTFFTPNAPNDPEDKFKFYLSLDPKTDNDPLTPIPKDFPLPAGDYIFTYDNRADITHNLVIEERDNPDKKLGMTGEPCPTCVRRTEFITLEAHNAYRFYCQVHDVGKKDPPMQFFVEVIE